MCAAKSFNSVVHFPSRKDLMKQPIIRGNHLRLLAKMFKIYLVLNMSDYFRCAKNNGSLKSNRKLITVNPFAE